MRFAKCAIEKVDQGGLITMRIAEPVLTHSDFENVFEDKLQIEYLQDDSSITELELKLP